MFTFLKSEIAKRIAAVGVVCTSSVSVGACTYGVVDSCCVDLRDDVYRAMCLDYAHMHKVDIGWNDADGVNQCKEDAYVQRMDEFKRKMKEALACCSSIAPERYKPNFSYADENVEGSINYENCLINALKTPPVCDPEASGQFAKRVLECCKDAGGLGSACGADFIHSLGRKCKTD